MEKQIDIIIPAYKAHKTIFKTLCSIAMQDNSDIVKVTIIDDHCPEGDYKSIAKLFKGQLDIDVKRLSENHGPGYARRYGIEHTSCPYIMFADADDTYMSGFTIDTFYKQMITANEDVVFSGFLEQHDDGFVPHYIDTVWVFGKMYRRQFLIDNEITFTDLRANEDTCFNRKIIIYYDNIGKNIPALDAFTYLWHTKGNSITRINHGQYTYDQSVCGFVDGMIEAFEWADKRKIKLDLIKNEVIGAMIFLYYAYCDVGSNSEMFQEQNLEYIKKFYNKVWKRYELDYHTKEFIEAFDENMKVWFADSSAKIFMAQPNIVQFMDMLADLEYNENDIEKIHDKIPEEIKQKNIECGVCSKDYYDKKK